MHCAAFDLGFFAPYQPSWTAEDNKTFELALAQHFRDSDRWSKIATLLPGKSPEDIQRAYESLEEDLKRIDDSSCSAVVQAGTSSSDSVKRVRLDAPQPAVSGATSPQAQADRRKGVPWTHEEHRLFLLGLAKFGKGSWRSIARQFVVTRTPTQVASHAQKYFLRLNSIKDKKDKRRASIHDMTTDDLVTHDVYGASAMGIIPGVPAPVPPAAQRKAIKA